MMANEDDFLDEFTSPKSDRNSDIDEMSSEELRQEIQQDKKRATRSLVLAVTALIAIIAICIAWFVANNVIKGGTGDVSAGTSTSFELASVGVRQTVEQDYYWNENSDGAEHKNILAAGEKKTIDSYYDIESQSEKNLSQEYNIGDNNIAWYQDSQKVMEPGASGKFEFYVIPKEEGHKDITITLKLEAYTMTHSMAYKEGESETSANSRAIRKEDEILQNLVDGHILLFRDLNSDGYSGWIPLTELDGGDDNVSGKYGNTFTLSAKADAGLASGVFEKNVPYKVTVYWVWPKYFRNYIYASRVQNGDLFSDIDNNTDYTALIDFVNNQKVMGIKGGSKLFYYKGNVNEDDDTDVDSEVADAGTRIDSSMSGELLNKCSRYYNLADEYIGNNAKFMYVSAYVE